MRFADNEAPKPLAPRAARYVKIMTVARLKSMTEDELLAELRNHPNPAEAQMIIAELLKPNFSLVAGFWAVIAGIAAVIVAVLLFILI